MRLTKPNPVKFKYSSQCSISMLLIATIFSFSLYGQSVKNGNINDANFDLVAADEFDFAGIWKGYAYEVVWNSSKQEVEKFDIVDSLFNVVFIRLTGFEDKTYEILSLERKLPIDILPRSLISLEGNGLQVMGRHFELFYEYQAEVKLYGMDAIQFNIDSPEEDIFFGKQYSPDQDLNIFWEFIRDYPD